MTKGLTSYDISFYVQNGGIKLFSMFLIYPTQLYKVFLTSLTVEISLNETNIFTHEIKLE